MGNKCLTKCYMDGCTNEVGFIESSFGIHYCEECERLFTIVKLKNIDISSCKTKKDLIRQLEEKLKNFR